VYINFCDIFAALSEFSLLAKIWKMLGVPSTPSCSGENTGDIRTLTLVTGMYNERLVERGEFHRLPDFPRSAR